MSHDTMNHRDRILAAIDQQPVDRLPTDIWCVPEIAALLMDYCGVSSWAEVLDALDIDAIPQISPPYIGPPLPDLGDGLRQDEWGFVSRRQVYNTGIYWEQVGYPLTKAETIADLEAFAWPDPDWYDYGALPDLCRAQGDRAVQVGYTAIFYFHNKLRGLDLSMMDLALRPLFSRYLIQRIADFFLEYHQRCFAAAGDTMQVSQVTDDFGSQKGLLISEAMFSDYYRPWMQRAMDLAKGYGLRVFHHDDGAILPLVPALIDMGIDILNPVQWRCSGMDRETLGRRFAGQVCFHGGVDNQETLPFGKPEDVRLEVAHNIKTLAPNGTGYIIAPCHNIQANTPLENILAMYQAPRS